MPTIVSRLPGRLRIRHANLRNNEKLASLCADLGAWDGVIDVKGNPTAGSIVVYYDDHVISSETIEALASARIAEFVGAIIPRETGEKVEFSLARMNRPIKIGMSVSLAATVGTLAISKGAHAAAGGALLVFLLLHMATYRRTLLR